VTSSGVKQKGPLVSLTGALFLIKKSTNAHLKGRHANSRHYCYSNQFSFGGMCIILGAAMFPTDTNLILGLVLEDGLLRGGRNTEKGAWLLTGLPYWGRWGYRGTSDGYAGTLRENWREVPNRLMLPLTSRPAAPIRQKAQH